MKRITTIMLGSLLLAACNKNMSSLMSPTQAPAPNQSVIILAGQSNMDRFTQSGIGESGFVSEMALKSGHANVVFVPCSVGGTTIDQWQYQGQLMNDCIAKAKGLKVTGILFWEGENDAANGNLTWDQQFLNMITGWRTYYPQVPIVFAQLALNAPPFASQGTWDAFKTMQSQIDYPGLEMIRTDDLAVLSPGESIHLSASCFAPIGARFADAYLNLLAHTFYGTKS